MLDYLSRVLNFGRGKKHKKGININWPAMGCPVCFLNVVLQQHQKCVRQCRCSPWWWWCQQGWWSPCSTFAPWSHWQRFETCAPWWHPGPGPEHRMTLIHRRAGSQNFTRCLLKISIILFRLPTTHCIIPKHHPTLKTSGCHTNFSLSSSLVSHSNKLKISCFREMSGLDMIRIGDPSNSSEASDIKDANWRVTVTKVQHRFEKLKTPQHTRENDLRICKKI